MLPFENLSRDPDNAYFADGIQDEILTASREDRGLKSDFAQFDETISDETWEFRRDRKAAWVANISGQRANSGDQVGSMFS